MTRVAIPDDLAAQLIFDSHRTCCVCRAQGRPIQIHHLDGDHSNSLDEENLVVLCVLCHDDTMIKGGFGRKLSAEVIRKYKDDWLSRVRRMRDSAERLALEVIGPGPAETSKASEIKPSGHPGVCVVDYVSLLPRLRKRAYTEARPGWDSGITSEMLQSTHTVIAVTEDVLSTLAMYYPPTHFHPGNPRAYIQEVIRQRFDWHRLQMQPLGEGQHGTMVIPMIAGFVLHDLETMVRDMVSSLATDWSGETDIFSDWLKDWQNAAEPPEGATGSAESELLKDDARTFNRRISITDTDDDGFVRFLNRNDGQVVFLNAVLDACVATQTQHERMEALVASGFNADLLFAGQISGLALPIQPGGQEMVSVTFHLLPGRSLIPSSGGTGVLTMDVRGFFELTKTFHSGPSTAFHLREADAPLEVLAKRLSETTRLAVNDQAVAQTLA